MIWGFFYCLRTWTTSIIDDWMMNLTRESLFTALYEFKANFFDLIFDFLEILQQMFMCSWVFWYTISFYTKQGLKLMKG